MTAKTQSPASTTGLKHGLFSAPEIHTFMRKLDVKEIHGYHAASGLKLLKPGVLKKRKTR